MTQLTSKTVDAIKSLTDFKAGNLIGTKHSDTRYSIIHYSTTLFVWDKGQWFYFTDGRRSQSTNARINQIRKVITDQGLTITYIYADDFYNTRK